MSLRIGYVWAEGVVLDHEVGKAILALRSFVGRIENIRRMDVMGEERWVAGEDFL